MTKRGIGSATQDADGITWYWPTTAEQIAAGRRLVDAGELVEESGECDGCERHEPGHRVPVFRGATDGERLCARREAAGLTQAQLATRLGVSRETIVRRESGALPITAEAALAIEAALDAAGAEIVECECGEWSGEACAWSGPRSETVRVRYVPGQWRGTAEAAGTWRGVAATMRVSPECAERIAEHDPDWTERA